MPMAQIHTNFLCITGEGEYFRYQMQKHVFKPTDSLKFNAKGNHHVTKPSRYRLFKRLIGK